MVDTGFKKGVMEVVWLLIALLLVFRLDSVAAEDSEKLHFAFTVSNDSLGDWHDRWRSSSVEIGVLAGANGQGRAPPRPGELLEYRFRSDILMPADIVNPRSDDRRHAGILAFGLHSYAGMGAVDYRIGGDLVVIGQQTGLYDFQTRLHKILGFDIPNLPDFQISDTTRLDVSAEAGSALRSANRVIRPFAEMRVGTEDMIRAGVDLMFGVNADDLTMRTETTGHRVPYGTLRTPGWGFAAGADVAWVNDSLYLQENLGYILTPARIRVRGGVSYRGKRFDVFYGLTWLGKEFEAQPEGQFVGTLQGRFEF